MISWFRGDFWSTGRENYWRGQEKSRPLFAKGAWNFKILLRGNDGGRSSMVEPQIVVLVVAGSSPVDHPSALTRAIAYFKFEISNFLECL
jgi:hypothetical protein